MITDDATKKSLENSVGQVAEFYEPGYNAIDFKEEDLQKRIDDMNPSLVYANIYFDDDAATSKGYQNLLQYLGRLMIEGRSCILVDTRHSSRWKTLESYLAAQKEKNVTVQEGKGDIA